MADRKRKVPNVVKKLRAIINEARRATAKPNSQPAISSIILGRPSFLKKVARTPGLRMHLMSIGLSSEIRQFFHHDPDEGDGVTTDQLELWPVEFRRMVKDIGQARVFVPSRNEFVLLSPLSISASETREAGEYLIAKGQDCIRRGGRLIKLAKRM